MIFSSYLKLIVSMLKKINILSLLMLLFRTYCFSSEIVLQDPQIQPFLDEYLINIPRSELIITSLKGGYSDALNYRIDWGTNRYVLKIQDSYYSDNRSNRELISVLEAAKKEIAPKILWVAKDCKAYAMEYVEGDLLTIDQAKKPTNIVLIAKGIRQIHSLPQNPIDKRKEIKNILKIYNEMKEEYEFPPNFEKAINEITLAAKVLSDMNISFVMIHGDLNSRNIFLTKKGVQFIDWSETNWEDPYYDLTCFTLLHDYDENEEFLFLQNYLGHPPTDEDQIHFNLVKRINIVSFSLNLLLLSDRLGREEQIMLNKENSLRSWNYYTTQFAENREELSSQFFYDWGRCSLERL